jgi:ABC-type oligopeptide transport system substrate-binding subunit
MLAPIYRWIICFLIGFIVGFVVALLIFNKGDGYKSFGDRLYGEKFKYPAYLDPDNPVELPYPQNRKIGDFGNTVLGN